MKDALQDDLFLKTEGDKWYKRNKRYLNGKKDDTIMQLLSVYNMKPKAVLEIGASNGYRLSMIYKKYKAKTVALEPSESAIKDGKKKYPYVKFIRGTASYIPEKDKVFDMVIINFVFHWIDRDLLLKSVSEIDRVLKNKSMLIIGDFFPKDNCKVPYYHSTEKTVMTYKQNYSSIFLASGIYHIVACMTSSHGQGALRIEENTDNKKAYIILQKDKSDLYQVKDLPH